MKFYQRFSPYAVALGLTAIAVLVTLWLEPFMLRTIGAFFYIAIILTVWYGGARPGIVVVVLSTAAINYWFIPPRSQFGFERPEDVFQVSLFLLVSGLINLLTSNFRDSKQKIEQLSQKLAQENIEQRKQTRELLQQKFEQQRLVMEITQRIRQSLNLSDILQTTVDEVRDYLKTDRVIIFKFTPAWGGTIVVESVAQEWMPILPLGIYDPCIGEEYVQPFIQGLVTAKSDIYNSGISPCHIEFLTKLQVRANLVVPVMKGDQLWGLLAAHHCQAPRQWQDSEIELLQQLAIQVSIALGQAALLEVAQTELAERKQAQIALQQREAILRLFVQYAPAGIAMFDRDMRYLMASQHWVDEYSLESVESLINRSHYDIFPEIPEQWRQIHQRCLAGAVEKCDEDLFVRLDGTQQWMWWEVHPWYTTKDEIGGIIIFAVDVSRRKQVEIALKELNASLEQRVAERTAELAKMNDHLRSSAHEIEDLYNKAPCGYHSLDGFGNVIRINDTELNWLGYSPEEIFYKPFLNFLTPESQQVFRDNFLKFKAQGWINNLEFEMVNKDGTTRWVSLNSTAIKDESGNYIMSRSTMFDISDRKLAEKALCQSEAKFRSLSESSPIGIFMTDIQGDCIYTNPQYQEICGCTSDQALGEGWSQSIHPEDREEITAQWSKAVSQAREFSREIRYVREDGTIRFGRVRSAPIFSITDELIGYVGTVEDVTEGLAIETMKNEFISIVSHELRTPLSSIRGSLGLLAAGVFKNKPETAQQMLDIAIHDTERLVRLVNDILDLERLDAQKVNLVKQWWDGVILLKQSVETVQSLAAESQILLSVEPTSVQVFVDRDRIIQTLVNLVSNAIKFSPPETTVRLSVQDQADQILFEVKDQGRGIPADQLETIFGRFQQVDASDSRQKGGTGLGLAISKSIVQQHGGKLWVESIVGEGSSFYFTLPKFLD